ncbi:YihY/virulence factor BrkB family protein [Planctomicrobium piriforme]|uniref:Membrane protein n=1 Tax=Planctomicrobium piriforme TaxID=1576369 RepID=A0A1I3GU33_9PLAN|nr:YihY/virulence factor BrkB family protein [Planctomicrobium piriforme]SFI26890.1 membrane protein [Planctomicrobium piriforme]
MLKRITTGWQFFRTVCLEFLRDDCATMAAALAFYAIFSIPPLVLIVISIAGTVWGEQPVEGQMAQELERLFGTVGKNQILELVQMTQQLRYTWIGSGGGYVILLAGATGMVVQFQSALNRVWNVPVEHASGGIRDMLVQRVLSVALIIGIAFLQLASLVLTTSLALFARFASSVAPQATSTLEAASHTMISLAVLTLMLAALFRWLPGDHVHWRDVWVGSLVTALLLTLGKEVLGSYLGSTDPQRYGTAGALVLLLLWIYYSAMILLFGAEFTEVWSRRGKLKLRAATTPPQ